MLETNSMDGERCTNDACLFICTVSLLDLFSLSDLA